MKPVNKYLKEEDYRYEVVEICEADKMKAWHFGELPPFIYPFYDRILKRNWNFLFNRLLCL